MKIFLIHTPHTHTPHTSPHAPITLRSTHTYTTPFTTYATHAHYIYTPHPIHTTYPYKLQTPYTSTHHSHTHPHTSVHRLFGQTQFAEHKGPYHSWTYELDPVPKPVVG